MFKHRLLFQRKYLVREQREEFVNLSSCRRSGLQCYEGEEEINEPDHSE